ncbi:MULTISPECIES: MoaD/ThiS family protein [Sphingobacterium]|uniref:MoaD/ThiS family protein n=1 Tax=Sphingobacterium TaxID=28453 RepID=UPI0013DCE3EB|nr:MULTISPECIES: MoaD/ThiS family protein [unclassified Sphingobacterium]
MKIQTFGKITEIIDRNIEIPFPLTLSELRKILEENFLTLSTISYTIAIDGELANDVETLIEQPKTIALLPPFSGG